MKAPAPPPYSWEALAAILKAKAEEHPRGKHAEIAHEFGVDPSTISNWLAARREPPFEIAVRLCAYLGVEVGSWLAGTLPTAPKATLHGTLSVEAAKRKVDEALRLFDDAVKAAATAPDPRPKSGIRKRFTK